MKRSIVGLALLVLLFAQHGLTRAATLFGVTGDGGPSPTSPARETLFTLSQTDASATFLLTLGAGGDGETIAFNPNDGLMYHASGRDAPDRVFEAINLNLPAVVASNALGGAFADEASGMTYNPATGTFLVSALDDRLYSVALNGVATDLGALDSPFKGLAFVGSSLFAASVTQDELHRINPLSGATLTTVPLTLTGFTVLGANGLATDPDTGVVWGVLRLDAPVRPVRHLVTLDPLTGAATDIGRLGDNFAGIAFAPALAIPEPSSVLMLAVGFVGLLAYRWKRVKPQFPAAA